MGSDSMIHIRAVNGIIRRTFSPRLFSSSSRFPKRALFDTPWNPPVIEVFLMSNTTADAMQVSNPSSIHPSYDFDNADLLILASDGVGFRVHSQTLTVWSLVFKGMVDIPRDPTETRDDAIHVEEPSDVWSLILEHMYPVSRSIGDASLKQLEGVGKAVVKYDIPFLVGSLHTCLTARTKQMMAHHPFEKYCVA